jgi:hypothetical protein
VETPVADIALVLTGGRQMPRDFFEKELLTQKLSWKLGKMFVH